jgi:hypothetical protein
LLIPNWERFVLVCPFLKGLIKKEMPGQRTNSVQDLLIPDAFCAKLLQELSAHAFVPVGVCQTIMVF